MEKGGNRGRSGGQPQERPPTPLGKSAAKGRKGPHSASVFLDLENETMAAPDVLQDVQSGLERLSLCLDRCGEALAMAPSGAAGAADSWEEAKSR